MIKTLKIKVNGETKYILADVLGDYLEINWRVNTNTGFKYTKPTTIPINSKVEFVTEKYEKEVVDDKCNNCTHLIMCKITIASGMHPGSFSCDFHERKK